MRTHAGRLVATASALAVLAVAGRPVAVVTAAAPQASQEAPALAALCGTLADPPAALAARAAALTAADRDRAAAMAAGTGADVLCGLAVLAAVRDPRVAPAMAAAAERPALRDDLYRIARWAAFAAGGPDASLGEAFLPLTAALDPPPLRAAAGDDGTRLLGEIDHASARERLRARLDGPSDAEIDAAIHALARQGDATARARVLALGREVAGALSTNPTYEQARRTSAAAFYLLALDAASLADGLALLRVLSPSDQADTAAWAVQTVCERAIRRPATRATLEAHRAALVAAVDSLGLPWRTLTRGAFPCTDR